MVSHGKQPDRSATGSVDLPVRQVAAPAAEARPATFSLRPVTVDNTLEGREDGEAVPSTSAPTHPIESAATTPGPVVSTPTSTMTTLTPAASTPASPTPMSAATSAHQSDVEAEYERLREQQRRRVYERTSAAYRQRVEEAARQRIRQDEAELRPVAATEHLRQVRHGNDIVNDSDTDHANDTVGTTPYRWTAAHSRHSAARGMSRLARQSQNDNVTRYTSPYNAQYRGAERRDRGPARNRRSTNVFDPWDEIIIYGSR